MEQLKQLAEFACQHRITGASLKPSSLLFPLDHIMRELEQEPAPEARDLVRASTTMDIYNHIKRVRDSQGFKVGATKRAAVEQYVNMFFDEVLNKAHHGDVNRLLAREKRLKSAYLLYMLKAFDRLWAAKGMRAPTSEEDEVVPEVVEEPEAGIEASG
jgi:CRISPR-associated protein Csc3